MCVHPTTPDAQPIGYRAKRNFFDPHHLIDVSKGNFITVQEFERLFFDEQNAFEPVYGDDAVEEGNFTERNIPGMTQ